MNVNDIFPGQFLKAHDLQGREPICTIAKVECVPMGRTQDVKPVVYFRGKDKGLKLNKTMAAVIASIAGSPDTDRWVGTRVQLFATVADFGGQTYDVVRVKTAAAPRTNGSVAPPVPVVVPVALTPILDDEIPF